MACIAYILLCHKNPDEVIAQARRLTAAGDVMAIHFDASAPAADHARIRDALAGNPSVRMVRRRVRCGWGTWSLVQATLNALDEARAAFSGATHFYMLSGDCMPIKSAEFAHAFLDAADADHIESVDFFASDWIRTGMKEDRLIYRHVFNERGQKRLFYAAYHLQRRLGLTRAVPADLRMMIGSQWWCLRRATVDSVLDFARARRDVVRFFRTTWIPDETFFQTLVRHLVPAEEIRSRTPTLLVFSDYGLPANFHNDHYDLLVSQDFLFARKISPEAGALKARLGDLYASSGQRFETSDEAPRLYRFLTGRGRVGRRFAPRFWETESSLGRDRELLVLACKKWHVGKRIADRAAALTGRPALHYVFHEAGAGLPDLGGIERSLEKRGRHRRALLRLVYEVMGTKSLLICVDPSDLALLRDVHSDRCVTRLLEVSCTLGDDYLVGHARRVGLAGPATPAPVVARLLPTLRNDLAFESERIRDANFPNHHVLREAAGAEENTMPLAQFLGIAPETALQIAATDRLFDD